MSMVLVVLIWAAAILAALVILGFTLWIADAICRSLGIFSLFFVPDLIEGAAHLIGGIFQLAAAIASAILDGQG